MSIKFSKRLLALVACVAPIFVDAEDIEVYTDFEDLEARQNSKANLMLILDTSGSMTTQDVEVEIGVPYDPATDYGNSDDNNYFIYNSSNVFVAEATSSEFVCLAAKNVIDVPNSASPTFTGRMAEW